MSSVVSSNASFPPLPLEVKGHILRFCDQQTLGRAARASLAFLELAMPILHDEIHIEGLEKMGKLFCARTGTSALDDVLTLRHVRSLTIIGTEMNGPDLEISTDRLPDGGHLVVACLGLEVHRAPMVGVTPIVDYRWKTVLPKFLPESVSVQPHPLAAPPHLKHAFISLDSVQWDCVRSVEFLSSTTHRYLGSTPLLNRSPGASIPLTVTYILAVEDFDEEHGMMHLVHQDFAAPEPSNIFSDGKRPANVLIRAPSDETLERFKVDLAEWMESLSEPDRQRRLERITFEVMDRKDSNVNTAA